MMAYRVWRDVGAGAGLSVCKARRDEQLPLASDAHAADALFPPGRAQALARVRQPRADSAAAFHTGSAEA